jgi:hypothetical protein
MNYNLNILSVFCIRDIILNLIYFYSSGRIQIILKSDYKYSYLKSLPKPSRRGVLLLRNTNLTRYWSLEC